MKAILTAILLLASLPAQAQQPNILLVLIDDFGPEVVPSFGRATYKMPNITKLSEAGMRFKRFYVSDTSSPTRAALLTGLYPGHNNVTSVKSVRGANPTCLLDSYGTIADAAQAAGYATASAGKWHVCDRTIISDPGAKGFDTWLITEDDHWGNEISIDGVALPPDPNVFAPDQATDFAIDFMQTAVAASQPFLLYYPTKLVHTPWQKVPGSTKTWADRDPRWYPRMVEYMDGLIGDLIDELDTLGVADNTVIFFMTDNGTSGRLENNAGQGLAGKGTTYESGINMPLIITGPGIPPGTVSTELTDYTDIYPTIVEMMGSPVVSRPLPDDGLSLVAHLTLRTPVGKPFAYSRAGNRFALIGRKGKMKLTERLGGACGLYNLLNDPMENRALCTASNIAAMEDILITNGLFPFD